jgi:hypothetical protein
VVLVSMALRDSWRGRREEKREMWPAHFHATRTRDDSGDERGRDVDLGRLLRQHAQPALVTMAVLWECLP